MGATPERAGRTGGEGDLAAVSRWGKDLSGADHLAPGPEFDLIRRLAGHPEPRDEVIVGVGDDAAVIQGGNIVLSSDLSIQDVHFQLHWADPESLGYRAAAAALSDLAAMGARAVGLLASIAVPSGEGTLAEGLMEGVRAAVGAAGGVLLGGDLSRSPGPVILDIVAVGSAARPVCRTGAEVGDEVWVTGRLGASGVAVAALLKGEEPPAQALETFRRPPSRIGAAVWLVERGIPRAMLDLSDGIGGDAAHLSAANALSVVLDIDALPGAASVGSGPERLDRILHGGEDYELLFAARPGSVEPVRSEFEQRFQCPLTRVGEMALGAGVWLRDAGGDSRQLEHGGFQHFGADR